MMPLSCGDPWPGGNQRRPDSPQLQRSMAAEAEATQLGLTGDSSRYWRASPLTLEPTRLELEWKLRLSSMISRRVLLSFLFFFRSFTENFFLN